MSGQDGQVRVSLPQSVQTDYRELTIALTGVTDSGGRSTDSTTTISLEQPSVVVNAHSTIQAAVQHAVTTDGTNVSDALTAVVRRSETVMSGRKKKIALGLAGLAGMGLLTAGLLSAGHLNVDGLTKAEETDLFDIDFKAVRVTPSNAWNSKTDPELGLVDEKGMEEGYVRNKDWLTVSYQFGFTAKDGKKYTNIEATITSALIDATDKASLSSSSANVYYAGTSRPDSGQVIETTLGKISVNAKESSTFSTKFQLKIKSAVDENGNRVAINQDVDLKNPFVTSKNKDGLLTIVGEIESYSLNLPETTTVISSYFDGSSYSGIFSPLSPGLKRYDSRLRTPLNGENLFKKDPYKAVESGFVSSGEFFGIFARNPYSLSELNTYFHISQVRSLDFATVLTNGGYYADSQVIKGSFSNNDKIEYVDEQNSKVYSLKSNSFLPFSLSSNYYSDSIFGSSFFDRANYNWPANCYGFNMGLTVDSVRIEMVKLGKTYDIPVSNAGSQSIGYRKEIPSTKPAPPPSPTDYPGNKVTTNPLVVALSNNGYAYGTFGGGSSDYRYDLIATYPFAQGDYDIARYNTSYAQFNGFSPSNNVFATVYYAPQVIEYSSPNVSGWNNKSTSYRSFKGTFTVKWTPGSFDIGFDADNKFSFNTGIGRSGNSYYNKPSSLRTYDLLKGAVSGLKFGVLKNNHKTDPFSLELYSSKDYEWFDDYNDIPKDKVCSAVSVSSDLVSDYRFSFPLKPIGNGDRDLNGNRYSVSSVAEGKLEAFHLDEESWVFENEAGSSTWVRPAYDLPEEDIISQGYKDDYQLTEYSDNGKLLTETTSFGSIYSNIYIAPSLRYGSKFLGVEPFSNNPFWNGTALTTDQYKCGAEIDVVESHDRYKGLYNSKVELKIKNELLTNDYIEVNGERIYDFEQSGSVVTFETLLDYTEGSKWVFKWGTQSERLENNSVEESITVEPIELKERFAYTLSSPSTSGYVYFYKPLALGISEFTPKALVKQNAPFIYDTLIYNLLSTNEENVTALTVLPFNGDSRGTSFSGTYTVENIEVKNKAGQVVTEGVDLYYSTTFRNEDMKPIDVKKEGFNKYGFVKYSGGALSSNVKSIFMDVTNLPSGDYYHVYVTMKPVGNKDGDKYVGDARLNSKEGTDAKSQFVTVEVMEENRSISGNIFWDDNYSGLKDEFSSPVLTELDVYLYNSAGQLVKENENGEAFVDANNQSLIKTTNGQYSFNHLAPGEYSVGVQLPLSYPDKAGIGDYAHRTWIVTLNNHADQALGNKFLNGYNDSIDWPANYGRIQLEQKALTRSQTITVGPEEKVRIQNINLGLMAHQDPSANQIRFYNADQTKNISQQVYAFNKDDNDLWLKLDLWNTGEHSAITWGDIDALTLPEGFEMVDGSYYGFVKGDLNAEPSETEALQTVKGSKLVFKDMVKSPNTPILFGQPKPEDRDRLVVWVHLNAVGSKVKPTNEGRIAATVRFETGNVLLNQDGQNTGGFYLQKVALNTYNYLRVQPDPTIIKEVDKTTAKVGEELTYTIRVKNAESASTWYDVVLKDALESYVSYVPNSTTLNGTPQKDDAWSNNSLSLSLGHLVQDQEAVVTFKVKVTKKPADGQLKNVATATGHLTEGGEETEIESEVGNEIEEGLKRLHVRQVIRQSKTDLVLPGAGFASFDQEVVQTPSGREEAVSEINFKDILLTQRDETVLSEMVPENYCFVGYYVSNERGYDSNQLVTDSTVVLEDDTYVTVVIEPVTQEATGEYSWSHG